MGALAPNPQAYLICDRFLDYNREDASMKNMYSTITVQPSRLQRSLANPMANKESLAVWNTKPRTRTTTIRTKSGRVVRVIPNNKEVILRAH